MNKVLCLLLLTIFPFIVKGANEYYSKIISLGYDSTRVSDLSSLIDLKLQEPECAYINISGISLLPTKKNTDAHAWLEYYDGNGVYFKKKVVLNPQGNSSMNFPKKNFSIEFCEDDWIGDSTSNLRFGNWVTQDGFHLKAFYSDYFKGGISIGAYKLYADVIADHNTFQERAGLRNWSSRATCFPDAFPCVLYFNGSFYGVYAWQLKKHRKNMSMDKDNSTHIHLSGTLSNETLFKGTIKWESIEVRNPKSLVSISPDSFSSVSKDTTELETAEPHESEIVDSESPDSVSSVSTDLGNGLSIYDEGTELLDETHSSYNPNNAAHVLTAQVKKNIQKFSSYYDDLKLLEKNYTPLQMREEIAKRYDVVSCIDYVVFSYVSSNYDGFRKNWQWFTYDGIKWFVAPYDLDGTLGNVYHSNFVFSPEWSFNGTDHKMTTFIKSGPIVWFYKYYFEEIKSRYAELRDKGVFEADHIFSYVKDWYYRVGGSDVYELEYKKWTKSLCNSKTIINDNWTTTDDWGDYYKLENYSSEKTYNEGDRCIDGYRVWIATATTTGVKPYKKLGYTDSLPRVYNWLVRRLELEDDYLNYVYTPKDSTEFELRISSLGIDSVKKLSSRSSISLDEPRCAFVNIISENGLPKTKNDDLRAYIEFHDNNGSYFKKKVILAQQGSDDNNAVKKNFALTFCEDDWIGEETTNLQFGKWVPQDEFHLKAYYGDAFCGTSVVANKLYGQIIGVDSAALTYLDAFPCVVYVNGDFYGQFAWQLKKQRKNMDLPKDDGNAVWLDGTLNDKQLFQGNVNWTKFEVRNPKTLYNLDGSEYDGNDPQELLDDNAETFLGKKKQIQCNLAKQNILLLSSYYQQLVDLETEGASKDVMRKEIAARFNVERLIQYMLFSLVTNNYKGFSKNWQWFTTDGKVWSVAPSDCSLSFGYNEEYSELWDAEKSSKKYDYRMLNVDTEGPMLWIKKYFWEDLKKQYANYRTSEVISTENIVSIASDWYGRQYAEDRNSEREKWNDSPCFSSYADSLERFEEWTDNRIRLLDDYLLPEEVTASPLVLLNEKKRTPRTNVYDMTGRLLFSSSGDANEGYMRKRNGVLLFHSGKKF